MQNDNSMTNKNFKKTLHDRWKRSWDEYQTKNRRRDCVALTSQIFKKRLKLYDNLFKIESSLVTQMRTNRIELAKYLFHRRVFIIVISACSCDWLRQTLKHVMLFCLNHNRTRESMLLVVETQNLRRLLNINKRVRVMTKWLMKTDILAQFSLTIECLEWFRSIVWAKRMHTKSTDRSQYFAFKTITCRLDDERAKRDFYSSEDFSLIHIVYNNSRMSRLKSMTQRVWNIIIIIIIKYKKIDNQIKKQLHEKFQSLKQSSFKNQIETWIINWKNFKSRILIFNIKDFFDFETMFVEKFLIVNRKWASTFCDNWILQKKAIKRNVHFAKTIREYKNVVKKSLKIIEHVNTIIFQNQSQSQSQSQKSTFSISSKNDKSEKRQCS
jgi:hypothetical protein